MGKTAWDVMASVQDSKRLNAVNESGILDTPAEAFFDDQTRRICAELNVPVALITVVGADRQFFKSEQGNAKIDPHQKISLRYSLCMHVVHLGAMLAVEDLRQDPRFDTHPAIHDMNVVSYLGQPLTYHGEAIGSVCAIDHVPRRWSERDISILRDVTDAVQAELYFKNL